MATTRSLDPWPTDKEELLVLSMDIGTTNTAASIIHLVPGISGVVRVVNKWPNEPNSAKVPTLLAYDEDGRAKAAGKEVLADRYFDDISDGKLFVSKWFKLHLHPSMMPPPPYGDDVQSDPNDREGHLIDTGAQGTAFEIPPLPRGVGVQKCYADMIRYVYNHAKTWYLENTPDGHLTWSRLGDRLQLVIAHPNGWSNQEQSVIRGAVIDAGLMLPNAKEDRLRLVTEAEASVHYGLFHTTGTPESGWLTVGSSFAVVDAGGSTVDTCVYTVESVSPKLVLREAGLSACIQCGAIFVTRAMRRILEKKLEASERYNTPDVIDTLIEFFEQHTKLTFDAVDENYILKFGMKGDTEIACGISQGRLKLTGLEVEQAFAPLVDQVIRSIKAQIKGLRVTHLLLVGGFGESPYVKRRLRSYFEGGDRLKVVTIDEPTQKAVAEGAAIHFAQDHVSARATRFEYGLCTNRRYDPTYQTQRSIIVFSTGKKFFSGGWTKIVAQGVIIESEQVYKEKFWVHKKRADSLLFSTTLLSYNGPDATGRYGGWSTDEMGRLYPGFSECCTITADLSSLAAATKIERTPSGEKYRELDFEVGLFFGGTELRACIIWQENGVECRGPASVIPPAFGLK
ncbi:hypothetical protein T439DRAFT_321963 [Meredithblackwellia eburnea MCA 4105]